MRLVLYRQVSVLVWFLAACSAQKVVVSGLEASPQPASADGTGAEGTSAEARVVGTPHPTIGEAIESGPPGAKEPGENSEDPPAPPDHLVSDFAERKAIVTDESRSSAQSLEAKLEPVAALPRPLSNSRFAGTPQKLSFAKPLPAGFSSLVVRMPCEVEGALVQLGRLAADRWTLAGFGHCKGGMANVALAGAGTYAVFWVPLLSERAAGDADGDGLLNQEEFALGTNWLVFDTDDDGLPDGDEVKRGTRPTAENSDHDGLPDGREVMLRSDPLVAAPPPEVNTTPKVICKSSGLPLYMRGVSHEELSALADDDGDGLPNLYDMCFGTRADTADSDGNGTPDAREDADGDGLGALAEVLLGLSPFAADSYGIGVADGDGDADFDGLPNRAEGASSPVRADSDKDGLPDGFELAKGTSPTRPDSDDDGIEDQLEVLFGFNPLEAEKNLDSDADGILDLTELLLGFHVGKPDSDGDGRPDGADDDDADHLSNAEECAGGKSLVDTDSDGKYDLWDKDDDNDGLASALEVEDFLNKKALRDQDDDSFPNWLDPDSDLPGRWFSRGPGRTPFLLAAAAATSDGAEGRFDLDGDGLWSYLDGDENCNHRTDERVETLLKGAPSALLEFPEDSCLAGRDLSRRILYRLRKVYARNARFDGATIGQGPGGALNGVTSLTDSDFRGASFAGASFVGDIIQFSDSDFREASFANATISGRIVTVSGSRLCGANVQGMTLTVAGTAKDPGAFFRLPCQ